MVLIHTITKKLNAMLAVFLSMLIVTLGAGVISTAEAQRYIDVEPDNFPAQIGNLNAAIENDTDRDEDTIYRLERGGTYWLDAIIEPEGGLLHIEGEDGDGPLPVIRPAADIDGQADELFNPRSDLYLRHVYLQGLSDLGEITKNNIRARGANLRIEVEDIYFDWDDQSYFRLDNSNTTLIIRDSKFRNTGRPGNVGVGRLISTQGVFQDTVIVENTTYYHGETGVIWTGGGVIDYMKWNHNTIVNTGQEFEFGPVITMEFTNNLLYDTGYRGLAHPTDEDGNPDVSISTWGLLHFHSVANIDEYEEEDRDIVIKNNNVGYISQKYWDVWDQYPDSVVSYRPTLIGHGDSLRAAGILVYEENFEEGVEFSDPPSGSVEWLQAIIENPGDDNPPPSFDKYDETFPVTPSNWDHTQQLSMWRDFSYPTSSQSYTAAEGDFPVGDLNWFPDKRAEWEGEATSTDEIAETLPQKFEIKGNYPNPFNPTTNISFNLANQNQVSLEVFNVLGARVSSHDLGTRQAGTHSYTYDASELPSGVYIVRMTAGNQVATSRMTLIK